MKKLLMVIALITLCGCATNTMWYFDIGDSTKAFYQKNPKNTKKLMMIEKTPKLSIYRAGDVNPLYFYFKMDTLVKVDRGVRSPDMVIENRNR